MQRAFGLIAVAMLLGGCGTTTIVKTVQSGPAQSASHGGAAPEAKKRLGIGDTATLAGEKASERIAVTLLRYIPSVSGGEYDEPQTGQQFVGARFRISNVGTVPYSDSPSNSVTFLTSDGEESSAAIMTSGECSGTFVSSVKIAPGDSEQGCVPVEISSAPSKVQFTPDSGFSDETAEWTLGSPSQRRSTEAPGRVESGGSESLRHCDPNVQADAHATCAFAENVFKAFAGSGVASGAVGLEVKSPDTNQSYSMQCTVSAGSVSCAGATDALVVFPLHAAQVF